MKKLITASIFLLVIFIAGSPATAEPLGYPWSTWGELSQTWDDTETGLKIDGYLEQGVDWFKIGPTDWVFNTFAGLRFVQSDQNNYWNNKFGPWFGLKAKHDFKLFPDSWGEVALGLRGEYYNYTKNGGPGDDLRGVLYLQWSSGGDWKKK